MRREPAGFRMYRCQNEIYGAPCGVSMYQKASMVSSEENP